MGAPDCTDPTTGSFDLIPFNLWAIINGCLPLWSIVHTNALCLSLWQVLDPGHACCCHCPSLCFTSSNQGRCPWGQSSDHARTQKMAQSVIPVKLQAGCQYSAHTSNHPCRSSKLLRLNSHVTGLAISPKCRNQVLSHCKYPNCHHSKFLQ